MSHYTTEVRFICESYAGLVESEGFGSIEDILTAAAPKVFNFDFPIWDESYRLPLEIKILRYYYTREICEETVGLWKLRLQNKLNLIMPYYNKLYDTTLIKYNPLFDVDLTTDSNRQNDNSRNRTNSFNEDTDNSLKRRGTVSDVGSDSRTDSQNERSNVANSGRNINKYSDTPQGAITELYDDRYLTNAAVDNHNDVTSTRRDGGSSSSGNSNNTRTLNTDDTGTTDRKGNSVENEKIKNTDDYLEHVVGTRGGITYTKKILELRDAIVNIDKMIIDDLSGLFFGLWG